MKITRVEPIHVRTPLKLDDAQPHAGGLPKADVHTVLVKVETDEGLTGWGEAFSNAGWQSTCTAIAQIIAPRVVGWDPSQIAQIQADLHRGLPTRTSSTACAWRRHHRAQRNGRTGDMNLDLKGKSVLVTGGNRGVGLGIALAFAEEGANVAVCGRDKEALAEAEAKIAAKGVKAKAVAVDLFTAAGCTGAVQAAVDAFGGLDVLVNNASTAVSGNIETLDDEGLMERLTGKTLAYMRCCRAALPHLRKSGRGRVICIGGTAGRQAGATALPSALGNSSIVAFVKQFSLTVAAQGITANTVHPPFTKTDRYPKRLAARAKQLGVSEEKAEASFVKQFPIGRLVEPKDIAPLVLFLASPHASAITGQSIAVDGGSIPGIYY